MIPRPKNVRIRRADGTVIPCELTYSGEDEFGNPMWGVATEMDHTAGDKLLVGWWPPNSTIEVPAAVDDPNFSEPPVIEDGVL